MTEVVDTFQASPNGCSFVVIGIGVTVPLGYGLYINHLPSIRLTYSPVFRDRRNRCVIIGVKLGTHIKEENIFSDKIFNSIEKYPA